MPPSSSVQRVMFLVQRIIFTLVLFLLLRPAAISQSSTTAASPAAGDAAPSGFTKAIFDYLAMAGTQKASDFRPLSQNEQNRIYLKSLINPVLYVKAALSGTIDHANNKPQEWEQGASGYWKRVANITGQYGIQRTVTFGLSTLFHEDNRYFGSGKKGFWNRTGYAVSSSILARHADGSRYPSVSLIGGFAAAAFISRSWQPPSTHSAGDGAASFGYSMGYNALVSVVKEFLPDMLRPLKKRRKTPAVQDNPGSFLQSNDRLSTFNQPE